MMKCWLASRHWPSCRMLECDTAPSTVMGEVMAMASVHTSTILKKAVRLDLLLAHSG